MLCVCVRERERFFFLIRLHTTAQYDPAVLEILCNAHWYVCVRVLVSYIVHNRACVCVYVCVALRRRVRSTNRAMRTGEGSRRHALGGKRRSRRESWSCFCWVGTDCSSLKIRLGLVVLREPATNWIFFSCLPQDERTVGQGGVDVQPGDDCSEQIRKEKACQVRNIPRPSRCHTDDEEALEESTASLRHM